MSAGNLSRLERGIIPYDQAILENCAREFGCSPVDLIEERAALPPEIQSVVDLLRAASPEDRERAIKIVRVAVEPSGTYPGETRYGSLSESERGSLHENRRAFRGKDT